MHTQLVELHKKQNLLSSSKPQSASIITEPGGRTEPAQGQDLSEQIGMDDPHFTIYESNKKNVVTL